MYLAMCKTISNEEVLLTFNINNIFLVISIKVINLLLVLTMYIKLFLVDKIAFIL
jgi:hypothetical protein